MNFSQNKIVGFFLLITVLSVSSLFSQDSQINFNSLYKYNFSIDYFDNRAEQLEKINLTEVKDAVKNILHAENMLVLNVGRV